MKILFLLFITTSLSGCAVPNIVSDITKQVITSKEQEQAQKKAIIATMNQYIDAINSDNRKLLAKLSKHNAMSYSVREMENGGYTTRERPQSYYLDINREKGPQVKERIWTPTVLVNDQIAILWAPYDYYVEGTFSHCGINAFNFIKENGHWLITNTSWSVQKSNCEVSPLGEP